MRSPSPKPALEPVFPFFIGVVLLHFLVGGIVWGLLPFWPPSFYEPAGTQVAADRYWFSPADYRREPPPPDMPLEPAPIGTTIAPPPTPSDYPGTLAETSLPSPAPGRSATVRPTSKSITLSPVLDVEGKEIPLVKSNRPPLTMMDMLKQEKLEEVGKQAAGGADMDPVLTALEDSLKESWNAPSLNEVPVLQRDAKLRIVINRDGSIAEAKMIKASGSSVLDASVTQATAGLKKISKSLPSSFPKDRYIVEVNFHIE
jgi:outer membrane biosynthesis protein TonB